MSVETWLLAWAAAAAMVPGAILWSSALLVWREPTPSSESASGSARVAFGPVTLIRPFRGLEGGALEKNLSLVRQRGVDVEVLFVAEDEDDPGVPAARAACAEAPGRARVLFSGDAPRVLSGKVRNMIAGWRGSRSPLVAFCDADITLAPDDLARCVAPFADPSVGATWMFVAFEEEGLLGRLWRLLTVADGFPVMRAAGRLGLRQSLQGGLMVIRREALEAAGGIEQLGDTFADDVRAGDVLQRAGYRLVASDRLLRHESPPEPLVPALQRFHRWTVCFRSEWPAGFFAHLLLNPVAIPLLVVAALAAKGSAWTGWALGVLGASILLRTTGTAFVGRALLRPRGVRLGASVWLRPLADLLFFHLCVAAIVFPIVRWRGRWYLVDWRGRIVHQLGQSDGTDQSTAPQATRAPGSSRSA